MSNVIEIKDGSYSIINLQTQIRRYPALGECKPSEVDLLEHEEIEVWDSAQGMWVQIDLDPTEFEKSVMNIHAFLDAIHDEIERMRDMQ